MTDNIENQSHHDVPAASSMSSLNQFAGFSLKIVLLVLNGIVLGIILSVVLLFY